MNGLHVPQNAVGTDSDDTGDPRTFVTDPSKDPEAWNAQLFRSITSNSAAGLPAQYKDAARLGLSSGEFTSQHVPAVQTRQTVPVRVSKKLE